MSPLQEMSLLVTGKYISVIIDIIYLDIDEFNIYPQIITV